MVIVATQVRLHRGGLVVQCGFVLRRVTAEEPVEAVETESGGPAVERSGRPSSQVGVKCALPK